MTASKKKIPIARLLDWGKDNFRNLPWRDKGTPEWHLLIAEILLKREIGERVVPVWQELIRRYSVPAKLARARRKTLIRIITPLGLQNQRTDALLSLAKVITQQYGGVVPGYSELCSLPWIGPYTAGAVEVFARGGRVPLLDPNILRVGSRYFGIPHNTAKQRKEIAAAVLNSAPLGNERAYYYAVLDLGAKVCKNKPKCAKCPLEGDCAFNQLHKGL